MLTMAAGCFNPAVRRAKFFGKYRCIGIICYFCAVFQKKGRLHFPRVVSLQVRAAGRHANNGTNAGASNTNANNTAANANANYSSPLYFAIWIYRRLGK
nr:MAG TPA: hypothetical protein [CrAss-like virus sp. cth6i5]